MLRYARDNTQNLDDIATEIMAEVKRENDLGDEPPKKRKKTFEEKNIERQDEFIDSHELERRVAALLGQNRKLFTVIIRTQYQLKIEYLVKKCAFVL